MIILCKKIPRDVIIARIHKEFPDYEIIRITDSVNDGSFIEQQLESQDLFGNQRLIFLSDIPEDFHQSVVQGLHNLPQNTVVFWSEDSFLAPLLKKIPPHTVWEEVEKKVEKINGFAITYDLLSGDPKKIWTTYQRLLANDFEPEAIFGILWWKLKDIAKQKNTLTPEFKKTMYRFLETYTTARQSGGELETGLEYLLLSINKKDLA